MTPAERDILWESAESYRGTPETSVLALERGSEGVERRVSGVGDECGTEEGVSSSGEDDKGERGTKTKRWSWRRVCCVRSGESVRSAGGAVRRSGGSCGREKERGWLSVSSSSDERRFVLPLVALLGRRGRRGVDADADADANGGVEADEIEREMEMPHSILRGRAKLSKLVHGVRSIEYDALWRGDSSPGSSSYVERAAVHKRVP
jgi:hypothetical protein